MFNKLLNRFISDGRKNRTAARRHRASNRERTIESLERKQLFAADAFVGVYDAGTWRFDGQAAQISFGLPGDQPVTGDWNGDGKKTPGVFRNGMWVLDETGNGFDGGDRVINFGLPGDKAIAGDWDGDGKDTVGVFRNGNFTFDKNGNGFDAVDTDLISFGWATDVPVSGDWNGDGKDSVGVFRNGTWVLDLTGNGYDAADRVLQFGLPGDQPVVGDWNGDGKDTPGVLQNGQWFFDREGNGYTGEAGTTNRFGNGIAVSGSRQRVATTLVSTTTNTQTSITSASPDKISVSAPVDRLELSLTNANNRDIVEYDVLGRLTKGGDTSGLKSFFHVAVKVDKIDGRYLNNPSNIEVAVYWAKGPNEKDMIKLAAKETITVNRQNTRAGNRLDYYFQGAFAKSKEQPVNATHLLVIIDPDKRLKQEELNRSDNVRSQKIDSVADLAKKILASPNISLATSHASGIKDNATALKNIQDVANGKLATRSSYTEKDSQGRIQVGPGGKTTIDARILKSILEISARFGKISISEVAGGVHGKNSKHYSGLAIDINVIRGRSVSSITNNDLKLIQEVREFSATLRPSLIYGPKTNGGADASHSNHFHLQWS